MTAAVAMTTTAAGRDLPGGSCAAGTPLPRRRPQGGGAVYRPGSPATGDGPDKAKAPSAMAAAGWPSYWSAMPYDRRCPPGGHIRSEGRRWTSKLGCAG